MIFFLYVTRQKSTMSDYKDCQWIISENSMCKFQATHCLVYAQPNGTDCTFSLCRGHYAVIRNQKKYTSDPPHRIDIIG